MEWLLPSYCRLSLQTVFLKLKAWLTLSDCLKWLTKISDPHPSGCSSVKFAVPSGFQEMRLTLDDKEKVGKMRSWAVATYNYC